MIKRKRNHRREYQRRVQRALQRGLSRSQARGHPRAGETNVAKRAISQLEDTRLQQGLRALNEGQSMTGAAKSAGLSTERLRKFVSDNKLARKRGQRWELIGRKVHRQWRIYSQHQQHLIVVSDPETNSVIGRYLNAVRKLRFQGNARALRRFRHVSVRDVNGTKYPLETNPNTLFELFTRHRETPEEFYRFII